MLSLRSDITFATEIRLAVKEIHWSDGLHCKFIVYCNQFSQLLNVSCLLASLWPTRTHAISLSSVLLVYWYLVGSARTISSLFNHDDVIKQTRYWPYVRGIHRSLLGDSPAIGEFPLQRPVTRTFDVFFDLRLNRRLSEQSISRWFETTSHSLWSHCNGNTRLHFVCSCFSIQWSQDDKSPTLGIKKMD